MKSKILKCLVMASAIAFVNCDDSTSAAASDVIGDDQAAVQDSTNTNTADPAAQATDPAAQATDPAQQTTDPAAQATDPAQQTTDPAAQATDPAQQSADPAAQATDPAQQVADPAAQTTDPATPDAQGEVVVPPGDDTPATPAVESSSSEEAKIESSSSEAPAAKKIFLAEGKEEEKDYLKVEYKQGTGPDGKSILSYPSQLSNDQKHAIVVWGPGGGTEPGAYEGMIRRLASHGFVVIALRESPGDGHLATEALDWLEKENQNPSSPLNGKLDMNTVGCSGHSMGGLESEQAVIKDKRVLTAFMNNSGDWNGNGANHVPTDRSIAILYGEAGSERGNAENDYNNQGVKAPACLIGMFDGPKGGEGGYGHGSGSWDGMAATVAWMRWHLGGETERKADFVGTSGKYINGNIAGHQGRWETKCKNF